VKTTHNNVHSLLHDSIKVAAACICERVNMGRPGDVVTTSVMGYDQTDDFEMVCFVPPTSSVCRVLVSAWWRHQTDLSVWICSWCCWRYVRGIHAVWRPRHGYGWLL